MLLISAGRRKVLVGKMTLGMILKFVTGSEWEPILGYSLSPKIAFTEGTTLLLPKSSTCINCLYLPIPGVMDPKLEDSKLFEHYDMAFANTFFGLQ